MRIPLSSPEPPTIRVAYADDHAIVREGISSLISRRSLLLPNETIVVEIQAGDGDDLLNQVENAAEKPDICLLDISMPGRNGFDTLLELKRRWPDMGVLAFTVFDIEHYLVRMMIYGANGYMLKNCSTDEMVAAILSVYHYGVYYPDSETMHLYEAIKNGQVGLPAITYKEMELLKLVCTELSWEEIADKLDVSEEAVEAYRSNLYRKLKVNTRTALAMFALQTGIVPIEINRHGNPIHY